MNKVLVTLVLALAATVGMAQGSPQSAPQTCPPGGSSQKTIKDPAEYNTYMAALNTADQAQKAALMEAFVKQYPQSVVRCDALEFAMAGWQQAGNAANAEGVAVQIIAMNPDHYRALLIIAYAKRTRAAQQTDPKQALALATEAQAAAEHALQVLPNAPLPEGVTKEEFDKQRAQIEPILQGIVGFGLLQKKDYAGARDHYLKSDQTDLQNAFQLALSELEMTPIDINGLWHVVKAAKLAEAQNNTAGAQQIAAYGKAKYKKYHGTADDWDAFAATTTGQTSLPPDLKISKAPTPCEIAVTAVNDAVKNNTLKDLSFGDREFVLQQEGCGPANKAAAEKVWQYITHDLQKDGQVKLTLQGVKVISTGEGTIDVALTDDNQKDNKADLHVILEKPATPSKPPAKGKKARATPPAPKLPAVGSMTDVTGLFTSYKADPFMFTMEKGELPPPPKAKVPPKTSAAGKKAAAKKKK